MNLFLVPDMAERMAQNLKFKPNLVALAEKTLQSVTKAHLEKLNKKRKKKKKVKAQDLVYVGIHIR